MLVSIGSSTSSTYVKHGVLTKCCSATCCIVLLHSYGFWYHLDKHSGGPSYSTSVCPKFTPLVRLVQ